MPSFSNPTEWVGKKQTRVRMTAFSDKPPMADFPLFLIHLTAREIGFPFLLAEWAAVNRPQER